MAFLFPPEYVEKLHPRGFGGKWVAKPKMQAVAPARQQAALPETPAPSAKAPAKAAKAVKAAKKAKPSKAKPMRYAEKAAAAKKAAKATKVKEAKPPPKISSINVFRGDAVEIPAQPKVKGTNEWEARWEKVDDAVLKLNAKKAIVDSPQWAQEKGRVWYSGVSTWLDGVIKHPDARKPDGQPYTKEEAAAVIAMYSSNNTWLPNLRQARDFILGRETDRARDSLAAGEPPNMHYEPTKNMLTQEYKDRKTGEVKKAKKLRDWFRNTASGSSKQRSFTANTSGDESALTADRFVARITLHTDDPEYAQGMLSASRTRADGTKEQYGYNRMAAAWTAAVTELRAEYPDHYGSLTNAQGQAIPWLVVGGDGTGIAIPHHLKSDQPGFETAGGLGPIPTNPSSDELWDLYHPNTPEDQARADAYFALERSKSEAKEEAKATETRAAYQHWLDQPSEVYPNMTRREEGAVKVYVRGGYSGQIGNEQLNGALRTRPANLTPEEKAQRDHMDAAVLANPLDRPVTVQRVITDPKAREEILANLDNPDYRYIDPGFASAEIKGTSPSMEDFAGRYGGDVPETHNQIFIEADLPKGTRLLDVGNLPEALRNDPEFDFFNSENEMILPRGTSWKIVNRLPDAGAPAPVIKVAPEMPTVARIPPDVPEVTDASHLAHLHVGRRRDGTMDWQARSDYVDQRLSELREQGTDTESRYRNPVTKDWAPARLALQEQLMDDLWAKHAEHVPNEGKAIFSGGLGGAGKGYALGKVEKVDPDQFFTINPDLIKEEMARRGMVPQDIDPNMTPMELSGVVHEESSDMANRLADRAYAMRKNVVWDITMSSEGSVDEKRVAPMREAGYKQITALFVDTTVERSIEQAKKRWLRGMNEYVNNDGEGGRFLPSGATRLNLPSEGSPFRSRNREVFEATKHLFDGWIQYENLEGDMKRVDTGGRGLLR